MSKQEIFAQLQKIMEQRGGRKKKRKSESSLEALQPEKFKNQYVDDGSVEYIKERANVLKNLALTITGKTDPSKLTNLEIKSVPESAVKKQLSKLKKQRDVVIRDEKRKQAVALKAVNKIYDAREKQKKINLITAAESKLDGADASVKLDKLLHPERYRIEGTKALALSDYPVPPRKNLEQEALIAEFGLGEIGKTGKTGEGRRRKKKLSAYNKHMSKLLKQGYTFKEAADMW
jgi:hypothetical protein